MTELEIQLVKVARWCAWWQNMTWFMLGVFAGTMVHLSVQF